MNDKLDLEQFDDCALYDVFYGAGTTLRSALLQARNKAIADGDLKKAQQYREEDIALRKERKSIDPNDTQSQIAHTEQWIRRARKIESELK